MPPSHAEGRRGWQCPGFTLTTPSNCLGSESIALNATRRCGSIPQQNTTTPHGFDPSPPHIYPPIPPFKTNPPAPLVFVSALCGSNVGVWVCGSNGSHPHSFGYLQKTRSPSSFLNPPGSPGCRQAPLGPFTRTPNLVGKLATKTPPPEGCRPLSSLPSTASSRPQPEASGLDPRPPRRSWPTYRNIILFPNLIFFCFGLINYLRGYSLFVLRSFSGSFLYLYRCCVCVCVCISWFGFCAFCGCFSPNIGSSGYVVPRFFPLPILSSRSRTAFFSATLRSIPTYFSPRKLSDSISKRSFFYQMMIGLTRYRATLAVGMVLSGPAFL